MNNKVLGLLQSECSADRIEGCHRLCTLGKDVPAEVLAEVEECLLDGADVAEAACLVIKTLELRSQALLDRLESLVLCYYRDCPHIAAEILSVLQIIQPTDTFIARIRPLFPSAKQVVQMHMARLAYYVDTPLCANPSGAIFDEAKSSLVTLWLHAALGNTAYILTQLEDVLPLPQRYKERQTDVNENEAPQGLGKENEKPERMEKKDENRCERDKGTDGGATAAEAEDKWIKEKCEENKDDTAAAEKEAGKENANASAVAEDENQQRTHAREDCDVPVRSSPPAEEGGILKDPNDDERAAKKTNKKSKKKPAPPRAEAEEFSVQVGMLTQCCECVLAICERDDAKLSDAVGPQHGTLKELLKAACSVLMSEVLDLHAECVLVMQCIDALGGELCALNVRALDRAWGDDSASVMTTWLEIMLESENHSADEKTDADILQLAIKATSPHLHGLALSYCGRRAEASWKKTVLDMVLASPNVTDVGYAELCNCVFEWFANEDEDYILMPHMAKLKELSDRWTKTNFAKRQKTDAAEDAALARTDIEDAATNLAAFLKYKDERHAQK